MADAPNTKTCARCGKTKKTTKFYRDNSEPDGRKEICRKCQLELSNMGLDWEKEKKKLEKIEKTSEKLVKEGAKKVSEKDIKKVIDKSDKIEQKFRKEGPLDRFIEDYHLLLSIVKDYWNQKYRKIPYWSVGAIVFVLLYILNPFDFLPDFIPFIGLIDDAMILTASLLMMEQDLQEYKEWKLEQSSE